MTPTPWARPLLRALQASHATAAGLCASATLTATASIPPDLGWASTGGRLALAAALYLITDTLLATTAEPASPAHRTGRLPTAITGLGVSAALIPAAHPLLILLLTPPLLIIQHTLHTAQPATDPKTGLLAATTWQQLTARELSRAARRQTALGVLVIDLDRFKQINDTHGHLTGDLVLRAVAAAITATVRDYDLVGRFGGDEFLVLLPDTTPTDTHQIAGRVRTAIAALRVAAMPVPAPHAHLHGGGVIITDLGASIGVATYPDHGDTADTLLRHADGALYAAKNVTQRAGHTCAGSPDDFAHSATSRPYHRPC